MKNLFVLGSILLVFPMFSPSISCSSPKTASNTETTPTDTISSNDLWMQYFNSDMIKLQELYTDNPVLIDEDGNIYDNSDNISEYFDNLGEMFSGIESIKTLEYVKVTPDIAYEIGTFQTEDKVAYTHLIVWNTKDKPLRELEVIAKVEDFDWEYNPMDARREQWIKLCNEHNATALVNDLYSENAIYYNHKPLVIGREAIAKEYSYMNNPKYSLHLSPIRHEVVNEEIAFEIGQCSGSYGGKYILFWKLDEDGVWRVLMDTNV